MSFEIDLFKLLLLDPWTLSLEAAWRMGRSPRQAAMVLREQVPRHPAGQEAAHAQVILNKNNPICALHGDF